MPDNKYKNTDKHKYTYYYSMATIVTRTRQSVTLHIYCLIFYYFKF